MPEHGKEYCQPGFPYRLEIVGRYDLESDNGQSGAVYAKPQCACLAQFRAVCVEDAYYYPGRKHTYQPSANSNQRGVSDCLHYGLLHTAEEAGAIVESDNRLYSHIDGDDRDHQQHSGAVDYTKRCYGDISAIPDEFCIHYSPDNARGQVHRKRGKAYGDYMPDDIEVWPECGSGEPGNAPLAAEMKQYPYSQYEMRYHRGDGGSLYSHVKAKDEYRIKYYVQACTNEYGIHRYPRITLGPDDVVQ